MFIFSLMCSSSSGNRFSEVADQEPSSSHDLPHTMIGHWQFPCKQENKLREFLSAETSLNLSLFS